MSTKFKHLTDMEIDLRGLYENEKHGKFRANSEVRAQFQRELEEANIPEDRVPKTKLDLLFRIAWDLGHSGGYEEVETYYNDLAPLVL